jgi:hypothetical protein
MWMKSGPHWTQPEPDAFVLDGARDRRQGALSYEAIQQVLPARSNTIATGTIREPSSLRMMNFLPIRFLNSRQSPRTASLSHRLNSTGLWNIFNPSVATTESGIAIAFRAGRWPGDKPFRAYYLSGDDAPVDLSEAFTSRVLPAISDPKLFTLNDEIWVTFNTGHLEKPNRIYIAQMHPNQSRPYELVLSGRQPIEKNWALFTVNGVLHAIYSISPLIVLRAVGHQSDDKIVFERTVGGASLQHPYESYALGSQLAALDKVGHQFALIAHRKFHLNKRRIYLGLPIQIRRDREGQTLVPGRRYLAHSLKSLLGDSPRHNPNLLSCTYFSGLAVAGDRAVLAYGVNDVSAAFAEVPLRELGFITRGITG